ncbi:MAG TPA: LLM class flavin-dependent oxidoreductase [Actinomycetota bacterium]|nr:LLM class flavin-dependent oxidoreductase [Actinomycetota bacterium]
MRYGLDLPNFGDFADVSLIAELAATAEESGWDGFFVWDHIARSTAYPPGIPVADVTVALTAIALATRRIRFGALVTPLPRRRPHKLARELVTLDHLSGGRITLGVGLGSPPDAEFEAFGEPGDARVRADLLDESLEVITGLWSGERVDFDGERLHVHTEGFAPRPVQQPRIPVWVAARWPSPGRPIRRAARWDGIVPVAPSGGGNLTADDIATIRDRVGRDDFEIVATPPKDASRSDYESAGATWWISEATDRDAALAKAKAGPPG